MIFSFCFTEDEVAFLSLLFFIFFSQRCINMYDIRLIDENPKDECGLLRWPPGLLEMKNYLGNPDVVNSLHATGKTARWVECDDSVSRGLGNDASPPSYILLPQILKEIEVVLFR